MTDQTLVVVKPDGVRRGLVGEVLLRFERKGFRIRNLQMFTFSRPKAEAFYSPHRGKGFFDDLVEFMTSGPVVAAVLEGQSAVDVVRRLIGATRAYAADPGTIRGDFSLGITDNVIHAADSPESFVRESKIIFR
ncbi:MAG: nucleoside-diphosphate kinase [Gammaproteobacteria bacterium]